MTVKGKRVAKGNRIIIGDIAGGTKPGARELGDNVTINNLWDAYRWTPGFRDMIQLEADALFSNGINEDELIDSSRIIECKEAVMWSIMAGYSATIVDDRGEDSRIESWHPYIDGVGFNFTDFSPRGHPIEIEVYMKTSESSGKNIHFLVPHYPCETDMEGEYMDDKPIPGGYGFFHLRTQGNIRGVQGLPQYLHL